MLGILERINKIKEFKSRVNGRSEEDLPLRVRAIVYSLNRIESKYNKLKDYRRETFKENKKCDIYSIIMKPVGSKCNIRCTYCFSKDNRQNKTSRRYHSEQMSFELVERSISQLVDYSQGYIDIIWTGGEVLLAGIDFFKQVLKIEKKYLKRNKNLVIKNRIQTNGTLLNRKWIDFLKGNSFGIGISLDGTELDHNLCRKYPNFQGTYKDVIHSFQMLRKADIKCGVISTIASMHSNNPKEFIESLSDKGIVRARVRPCIGEDLLLSSLQYAGFIIGLFDTWLDKGGLGIDFSTFEDIFLRLIGIPGGICSHAGSCGNYPCIEANGDVWLCDHGSLTNENYLWGNILELNLVDIMNSKRRKDFLKVKEEIYKKCFLNCKWAYFCFGDCMYNHTIETGGVMKDKSYYCKGLKRIFGHIISRFDQIIQSKF